MALGRNSNEQEIGRAEAVRVEGKFSQALKLATKALDINKQPLTEAEIAEIAKSQSETAVFAAGARLIADTTISKMKRSLTPWELHLRARGLMNEIGIPVYKNDTFRNAAEEITVDNQGSPYNFDKEIARDIANYLIILSLIYPEDKGAELINLAAAIYDSVIEASKLKSSDRAFFSLEKNWFLFQTGNIDKIDPLAVAYDLESYYQLNGDTNLDRMATLATRALKIAQSVDQVGLAPIADDILIFLKEKHPDYFENKSTEPSVSKVVKIRNKIMKVFAPTSGFPIPGSRTALYSDSMALGNYQQGRFNATVSEQKYL